MWRPVFFFRVSAAQRSNLSKMFVFPQTKIRGGAGELRRRTLPLTASAHSTRTVPATTSPARYEVASIVTTTLHGDAATLGDVWLAVPSEAPCELTPPFKSGEVSLLNVLWWWSSCRLPPTSGRCPPPEEGVGDVMGCGRSAEPERGSAAVIVRGEMTEEGKFNSVKRRERAFLLTRPL